MGGLWCQVQRQRRDAQNGTCRFLGHRGDHMPILLSHENYRRWRSIEFLVCRFSVQNCRGCICLTGFPSGNFNSHPRPSCLPSDMPHWGYCATAASIALLTSASKPENALSFKKISGKYSNAFETPSLSVF